jgi:dinuclear metal center YbgI/SA1388 family protein
MAELKSVVAYMNRLLAADRFQDYAPNGLQVQGRGQVEVLVTGVTASLACIEAAIERGADALLVHHGYFWRGEDPCVVGMKRRRLARLLGAELSLIAYHLPLDAHERLGNNAQLAARLGWRVEGALNAEGIGQFGRTARALDPAGLGAEIARVLGREPLHIAGGPERIERLGWCTGAAQDYIEQAIDLGLDAFVSGEVSERTTHIAREAGIHYYAAGHHATERYGVQALGADLAREFGLRHEFVDIENPV